MDEEEKADITVKELLEVLSKCPKEAVVKINTYTKIENITMVTDLETNDVTVHLES